MYVYKAPFPLSSSVQFVIQLHFHYQEDSTKRTVRYCPILPPTSEGEQSLISRKQCKHLGQGGQKI